MTKHSANEELIAFNKYDSLLRKKGFTPSEIMAIKRICIENQRDIERGCYYKVPMVMVSLMINVLNGNRYLSKKKIKAAAQEVCELYEELKLELLDTDDVMDYNKNEADITIIFDKEPPQVERPTIKVSGMKSHQERLINILDAKEKKLTEYVEADDNDDEAYTQLRLLEVLKREFEKEGLI